MSDSPEQHHQEASAKRKRLSLACNVCRRKKVRCTQLPFFLLRRGLNDCKDQVRWGQAYVWQVRALSSGMYIHRRRQKERASTRAH